MSNDRPFANPYWRRLAEARPRLNSQVNVSRHEVRGRLWYVVEDALSGRHFRLTPEAWYFVGLLDGSRTVETAMKAAQRQLGEVAPQQEDVIRLLNQLYASGAISDTESAPDTATSYDRMTKLRQRRMLQQLRSPLAIRFSLIDPDRILDWLLPLGRLVFSPLGFVLWLGVIGYGISTAVLAFGELSHNFVDRVLSTGNAALMVVVFAFLKLVHEFSHGAAVKRWGGEVHDMGIMLLVLVPVPFVDASAANSFPSRFRRIVVASAGMYAEAFLAAIAIILWRDMEPGLLRAAMFNAALIGSVSTLLFNANPLLRFDGYYIFSDLISIPNLGTRSRFFFRYVLQRWLLRLDDAVTPETERTEMLWLFAYAISSTCYRITVITAIAFFVAQKFFFVGVALALWAVTQFIAVPILGAFYFLAFSPRLRQQRVRAWMRAGLAFAVLAAAMFLLPAPRTTYAHGVVWVPERGEITVATDGFITGVPTADGTRVAAGDVLIVARNEQLVAERERLRARLSALEARYRSDFVTDRVALRLTRAEVDHIRRRLSEVRHKLDGLTIRAAVPGTFALVLPEDLIDRFVHRGERLGFVIPDAAPTVRVAVGQNAVGMVRDDLRSVEVLPVRPGSTSVEAEVVRAVPQASAELPSMALSTMGGGDVEVAPDGNGNYRALERLFHLELRLPAADADYRVGQKVHVKFVHSMEPLGLQLWRWLRQLFLRKLNV
jgi:putative peptide zinc metalloprotease protein